MSDYDLHMHSTDSDGELDPVALARYAISKGLKIIAITDHDYINPVLCQYEELEQIVGVELSVKTELGRMHILGYGFDRDYRNAGMEALNKRLAEERNNNLYYILAMIAQIKKDYDITFSKEEIDKLLDTRRSISRADIGRLCFERGYSNGVQDAFDKYLIDAYQKTKWVGRGMCPEEALQLIKNAGGVSSLAHPNTLKVKGKDLELAIKDLKSMGLDSVEVYHSGHSLEETQEYLNIANRNNLLYSGGSDYHGPIMKPNIELGSGINNNLKIKKLTILDAIRR